MGEIDGWLEACRISIAAQAGADVAFQALSETVDIDTGTKGVEGVPLMGGGRITKHSPLTDTEITLEAYPQEAGTDTGSTGKGFFDLLHTADTSQPVKVDVDRTRSKYRIAIMWTNAASTVNAEDQVVAPTNEAIRVVASHGYFTSVKPSFTDGILKFTITFKVPAFDRAGTANVMMESVGGSATATMTALASYTSTVRW